MNRVYEWSKFYNPKKGLYQYRHKGSGLITNDLSKIGQYFKKTVKDINKLPINKTQKKSLKSVLNRSEKAGDLILKRLAQLK